MWRQEQRDSTATADNEQREQDVFAWRGSIKKKADDCDPGHLEGSDAVGFFFLFFFVLPVAAVAGRSAAELQPWLWVRGRLCLLCSGLAGAGTHCGEGQQTGTAPTQIPLWGSCGVCPGGHVMITWSVLQAAWSDRGEMHRCADQWSRRGQFRQQGCTFVILDDYSHVLFTASCFKGNSRFFVLHISSISEKIINRPCLVLSCLVWPCLLPLVRWGNPVFETLSLQQLLHFFFHFAHKKKSRTE